MKPWEGVVKIPAGKVGDYEIMHFTRPAGEVERANLRTAFCGGQADPPLVFDHETKWHRLSYSGGTWMTDLPIEQIQHDKELEPVLRDGGSVLVGGLGVGYAANVLAACELIERIVIVEISPEVISLVGPHLIDPEGKIEIVNADLFEFLKKNNEDTQEQFDWGFYDIWQSDSEGTFHQTVCPLRDLSQDWIGEVICWNENVMRGQLALALQSRLLMLQLAQLPNGTGGVVVQSLDELSVEKGTIWHDWAVPFFQAVRDKVVPGLTVGEDGVVCMSEDFMTAAGAYAGTYGHSGWKLWWEGVRRGNYTLQGLRR